MTKVTLQSLEKALKSEKKLFKILLSPRGGGSSRGVKTLFFSLVTYMLPKYQILASCYARTSLKVCGGWVVESEFLFIFGPRHQRPDQAEEYRFNGQNSE